MNLSKDAKNLILNMVMGDGYLDKAGHFICLHCEKQKQYLEWKYNLLKEHGVPMGGLYPRDNNGYPAYIFRTKKITWIFSQKKYIYGGGKKNIAQPSLLNKLSDLGLAIWYMDDGSLSYKKRNGKVHAHTITLNTYITREENQIIIDFIKERWDVKFNQHHNKGFYRLSCGTREGRKLFDIIRPYVNQVECMKYKINL